MKNKTLTAVPGIRVGHATNREAATGCTVVICPPDTVGGVDQRGGAPGTRETDLLMPMHHVSTVSAVLLSGGSAFGLAAADGVVRWCEENEVAYRSGLGYLVPIVPAAILMDLPVGRSDVRPDAAMGYAACVAATTEPVADGSVGAGTGARIGGFRGNAYATKGGIGSAAIKLEHDLVVAALVAVNAVGDVIDETGEILGGVRADDGSFVGMLNLMRDLDAEKRMPPAAGNTVIGVVATNAILTKEQVNKIAQMAHDGLARAVNPAHTMYDGDTIFGLATGSVQADVNVVGAYAAEMMAQAIRNGVLAATSVHDVRAWNDWYTPQR